MARVWRLCRTERREVVVRGRGMGARGVGDGVVEVWGRGGRVVCVVLPSRLMSLLSMLRFHCSGRL